MEYGSLGNNTAVKVITGTNPEDEVRYCLLKVTSDYLMTYQRQMHYTDLSVIQNMNISTFFDDISIVSGAISIMGAFEIIAIPVPIQIGFGIISICGGLYGKLQ